MPRIRTIHEITLTASEQGQAKQDRGFPLGLPCKSEDIIIKLENGVPLLMDEESEKN